MDEDQHVREAEDGWLEMQRQADEDHARHDDLMVGDPTCIFGPDGRCLRCDYEGSTEYCPTVQEVEATQAAKAVGDG